MPMLGPVVPYRRARGGSDRGARGAGARAPDRRTHGPVP